MASINRYGILGVSSNQKKVVIWHDMVVSINGGTPEHGWFIREKPAKTDDLGVSPVGRLGFISWWQSCFSLGHNTTWSMQLMNPGFRSTLVAVPQTSGWGKSRTFTSNHWDGALDMEIVLEPIRTMGFQWDLQWAMNLAIYVQNHTDR